MSRYEWPRPAVKLDDPVGRTAHVDRYLPATTGPPTGGPAPVPPVPPPPPGPPAGDRHLWFPIGPSVMTHGQAQGTPNVAGRIRDLAVEPDAGQRVYAASASGGVWFSADAGGSWQPLDEWVASPNRAAVRHPGNALACGSIHVEWGADAAHDEVWVGTGELSQADGQPGGKLGGIGILHAVGPASGVPWSMPPELGTIAGGAVYRIAGDPGHRRQLVAATTAGVFVHPAGGSWAAATQWGAAAGPDPGKLDVVLTRHAGNVVRVWIAAESALFVGAFTDTPSTPIPAALAFSRVTLPRVLSVGAKTRLQLATTNDGSQLFVLGRRDKVDDERIPPACLWRVATNVSLSSTTPPSATELPGLDPRMFESASDQSWYDMCITVHPAVPTRVYVGGAAVDIGGEWNAALYRCETSATTVSTTVVGHGVHSDVHVIRVGPQVASSSPDRAVWVGCDGGVFLSELDGVASSFTNRNNGLAVLEPGFVACHPTNDGIVAAGFQDNGTAHRVGSTVWRQRFGGDGGGIVFDPGGTTRYMRQYTNGVWHSDDGGSIAPVMRRRVSAPTGAKTSEEIESTSSEFYCGCDAVEHGGRSHFVMGTNRVWYSPDWGRSWATLPAGTDPRAGDNPDLAQDVVERNGTASGQYADEVPTFLCCTSTHRGSLVTGHGILAVKIAAISDDGGQRRLRVVALFDSGAAVMQGTQTTPTGTFTWRYLGKFLFRDPVGAAETAAATNGDPIAHPPIQERVSDVTWDDPDAGSFGSFYVTTIGRNTAIDPDTLWWFDGTSTWRPCGVRATVPNGAWTGTRVTAPALSVKVDRGVAARPVYVGTSVGVVVGTPTTTGGARQWAWEQRVNGLPEGAVHDLAIYEYGNVRLLRAALQARGVWETDLVNEVATPRTYVRVLSTDSRRRLPVTPAARTSDGDPGVRSWDVSPDIVVDTTSTVFPHGPTEAELLAAPPAGPPGARAATAISERHPKVHVLVHHRWRVALAPADVRVLLLRKALTGDVDIALGGLWPALLAAQAATSPPASLPDGWRKAGAALWERPLTAIETRMPRGVTFDVDLSGDVAGTQLVLLAVVLSAADPIGPADLRANLASDATTVRELVLRSPHVAARTLMVR